MIDGETRKGISDGEAHITNKVKGHASDPLSNRVDALAIAAIAPFKRR